MSQILETIKSIENVLALSPVGEEKIKAAEDLLGLKFSEEYKDYTKTYGAVSIDGTSYTGVVDADDLNVVKVTESARKITPQAPKDWYVVSDPHIEAIIVWQTSNGEIFITKPGMQSTKIAASLSEYILKCGVNEA